MDLFLVRADTDTNIPELGQLDLRASGASSRRSCDGGLAGLSAQSPENFEVGTTEPTFAGRS